LSLAPFAFDIIPIDATSLASEGLNNFAIIATNHLCSVLQTKINPRESGGKKNANWVVSLSLKSFTYSFAKVEIDFKD
jgi:hypothetical protein